MLQNDPETFADSPDEFEDEDDYEEEFDDVDPDDDERDEDPTDDDDRDALPDSGDPEALMVEGWYEHYERLGWPD
jgi:hypothetical protein